MSAALLVALFLLLAHESLLLTLRFLKTSHEAALLARFPGVLTHDGAHLLFLDDKAEDIGLRDGDEKREEIVDRMWRTSSRRPWQAFWDILTR